MRGLVSVRKVRLVVDVAADAGASRPDLLARAGLSASSIADPEGWLPQDAWRDVWVAAVDLVGDPLLGLKAGTRIDRGYFGVVDYVVRSSRTVGEAMMAAARFFRLANTQGELHVERGDGTVRVVRAIAGDETLALPRQAAEFSLAAMTTLFRQAAAEPWAPERVELRHPAPADASEHRRVFGCPVVFGAPADAITVSMRILGIPIRWADDRLRLLVERHGDELLAQLPAEDDVVGSVRKALARALTGGDPDIDAVAAKLGMSRRTLQRRLGDADTTYAAVLTAMRRELAERYLAGGMSPGEVAYLLGYAESSAFFRAFRGWTGLTPGERSRLSRIRTPRLAPESSREPS